MVQSYPVIGFSSGSTSPKQGRSAASAVAPAANYAQPRFGSGALYRMGTQATDGLLKIFNMISEEYLYAFLALDVVALWITRIAKGIDRGRIVYDPTQDPSLQGMPPWQQLKHSIQKNIQGLNWANGREEALREILTGPGSLIMPTLAFAYARNKYKGSGMQLGYPAMVELKNTYMDHLARTGLNDATQALAPEAFQKNLAQFLVNLFDDPAHGDLKKMLNTSIEIAHPGSGTVGKMTVRDYIARWAEEWSKKATEPLLKPASVSAKSLDDLAGELKEALIHQYNRQYIPHGATRSNEVFIRTLQEAGKSGKLRGKTELRSLEAMLDNLKYFKDYALDVYKTHSGKPNSKIGEVAEYAYRRLTRNKFIFAFIATMVASMYLYTLPRLVQKEGHYPANRLYQAKDGKGDGKGSENAASHQHSQPFQAAQQDSPQNAGRRLVTRPAPEFTPVPVPRTFAPPATLPPYSSEPFTGFSPVYPMQYYFRGGNR